MQTLRAGGIGLVLAALVSATAAGQRNVQPADPGAPTVGAWRGTIRAGADAPTPLVLSIIKRGDSYAGAINIGGANEIPLRRVTVDANRLAVESGVESKIGTLALTADLLLDGNKMSGTGTMSVGPLPVAVTIELQRQPRADVLQPTVEQRAAYFVGRWTFEYLGGEFAPLSPGSRTGTATFTGNGTDAVTAEIAGTADGKPYREQWSMTFDPATQMLAVVERRSGGPEVLSVGNWQTPLAIRFTAAPVRDQGRRYQLRRLLRVLSDSSFNVVEEFSIDGGPYRRLGQATFEKVR